MRQPKRWLKKVTNSTVWTYDPQLAERTDVVEIAEAEALYMQGKGPEPHNVAVQANVAPEIVEILNKMKPAEQAELVRAARMISNPPSEPKPGDDDYPMSAHGVIPPEPEPVAAITPEPPTPNPELEEDVPPPNDGTPQVKNDQNMKVESLDKPLSKMTKGELDAFAQAYCNKFFDLNDPKNTNKNMRIEIERLLGEKEGK